MQLSTERQDRLIRWLTAAGIYYICLIAFYIDICQDMGAEYFIPVFLPVMLAAVIIAAAFLVLLHVLDRV